MLQRAATTARPFRSDVAPPPRGEFISVVIPLCDEEANLMELHRRLTAVLSQGTFDYELLFVDDGSRDATPRLLAALAERDGHVTVVRLTRNFGHQAAVCAGLDHAAGDAVIVMDGDLQDPPEELPRLIERWRAGCEVVFAVRRKRKERLDKRLGYYLFYRLMRWGGDVDLPLDSGDFCLMDRKAVDALVRLPERDRFVRGLRRYVGFRQSGLEYERGRRAAGVPKYTLWRLAGLACDGLFNFSALPARGILAASVPAFALSLVLGLAAAVQHSTLLAALAGLAALGGGQLLALAVLAEYLRRILREVKGRPTYIVRDYQRGPAVNGRR